MATQVQTKAGTWTGSIEFGGKHNYSVVYTVRTDDLELGADCILSLGELPVIGDRYELLDDEVARAYVTKKSARQKSPGFWEVTVTMSTKMPGDKDKDRDEDDDPTDDWRLIGNSVTVSTVRVARAAQVGAYISKWICDLNVDPPRFERDPQKGWDVETQLPAEQPFAKRGKNQVHHIGNGIPITNSARTRFDPPPEIDYSRIKINYTMLLETFPTSEFKFVDTVNRRPTKVVAKGFDYKLKPFTAKLNGISGSYQVNEGDPYWRVTYEIEVDELFTWRYDLLDQGYVKINPDTNKKYYDDAGNPIGSNEETEKWMEVATDARGLPMQDPVKLDGLGEPVGAYDNTIYLRYALYPEVDWADLMLDANADDKWVEK